MTWAFSLPPTSRCRFRLAPWCDPPSLAPQGVGAVKDTLSLEGRLEKCMYGSHLTPGFRVHIFFIPALTKPTRKRVWPPKYLVQGETLSVFTNVPKKWSSSGRIEPKRRFGWAVRWRRCLTNIFSAHSNSTIKEAFWWAKKKMWAKKKGRNRTRKRWTKKAERLLRLSFLGLWENKKKRKFRCLVAKEKEREKGAKWVQQYYTRRDKKREKGNPKWKHKGKKKKRTASTDFFFDYLFCALLSGFFSFAFWEPPFSGHKKKRESAKERQRQKGPKLSFWIVTLCTDILFASGLSFWIQKNLFLVSTRLSFPFQNTLKGRKGQKKMKEKVLET